MTNDTPKLAVYEKRLAALEKHMEVLARALSSEQKKTAELRQALEAIQPGLEQASGFYDRAFEQAAKSYEPIIRRALELSGGAGSRLPATSPPASAKGQPPSFFDNITAIVDDLPKVLASLALIISLITGGTSVVSFIKSSAAQVQAESASENAGVAVQEANNARVEASAANEKAETAQQNSETAVNKASEAQVEAVTAKEKAETASAVVEKVIKPVIEGEPSP